jgi:hypothetical protein
MDSIKFAKLLQDADQLFSEDLEQVKGGIAMAAAMCGGCCLLLAGGALEPKKKEG